MRAQSCAVSATSCGLETPDLVDQRPRCATSAASGATHDDITGERIIAAEAVIAEVTSLIESLGRVPISGEPDL